MIDEKDAWKLKEYAKDLALLLDDEELEDVIVTLVGVKMERARARRGP